MIAGYLRVWRPIAMIVALFVGLAGMQDLARDQQTVGAVVFVLFTGVVLIARLAGTIAAWAFVGKLSDEDKRKHSVYALHSGSYVGPPTWTAPATTCGSR